MLSLLLVKVEVTFLLNLIIMAEVVKNDKNFLIIKMNYEEASKCNFGMLPGLKDNIIICGSCNVVCDESELYYIAGINEVLCKDCMEDFIKNMNHYVDSNSLKYEIKHFNYYANILNIDTNAGTTPEGKLVLFSKDEIKE